MHVSVLVTGPNVHEQLAPFDENLRDYNPRGQWDWYSIGGRWTGFFPLREGVSWTPNMLGSDPSIDMDDVRELVGRADQVQLKDVDFERARMEAEREARQEFDKWKAIYERLGRPDPWSKFNAEADEEVEELRKKGIESEIVGTHIYSIDRPIPITRAQSVRANARERYHRQPAIQAYKSFFCPVRVLGFDEEKYVSDHAEAALVPGVLLHEGEWLEQEGSWLMKNPEWSAKIHDLYRSLSEDTLLTIVDCHS